MSRTISEGAGRVYGVARVCSVWGVPRSSYYAWSSGASSSGHAVGAPRPKRGPKTALSDDGLLAIIRAYLDASPFAGEGHRKVFAHIKYALRVPTSRSRVLRLMRENQLLSPHRIPSRPPKTHDGSITTSRPNMIWGTDAFRVETSEEGWVWGFIAVDHFNSECVGYHIAKSGSRFEALEPVAMGLHKVYGATGQDAARGLMLRMDHGCQYTSDHFLNQVAYWGITPSFAFVREPQGNGIAERFIKTLKQQVIYGHIFKNSSDLHDAVATFVDVYNRMWRIERLGFLTPAQARSNALTREAA